jgi:hypothetical protein
MIKLVETATFPDGTSKVTSRDFSSRIALEKVFKKNILPFKVLKELRLHDEARIKMPWLHPETKETHEVNIIIKIEDIKKDSEGDSSCQSQSSGAENALKS